MSQAKKIKTLLERRIVSGDVKRGEKLDEQEIANEFQVSRTPVREAFMMLEGIGLVERKPRQGTVVVGTTLKRMLQMLETLAGLEAFAGSLAARRLKPADKERLKHAFEKCAEAARSGDPDLYYDANIDFHCAIYDAAHNEVLSEQLRYFGERMEPFLREQHQKEGWIEKTMEDHQEILDALEAGNASEVADLMRTHVFLDSEHFMDLATNFD